MKNETKIVAIKDIVVGKKLRRSLENVEKDDDFQSFTNSLKKKGQLHPCLVRKIDNKFENKFELIAGGRRYAALSKTDTTIEVKIVEASDLEANEYALTENNARKNPDEAWNDALIYDTWLMGIGEDKYKYISDISSKVGLSDQRVNEIINAEEYKRRPENLDNAVIQTATTKELTRTKSLENYPDLREKILKLVKDKSMTFEDTEDLSIKVKTALDLGIKEDIVTKTIDVVSPSVAKMQVVVQPKKFDVALGIMTKAPQDIIDKLADNKISLEQASIVINKGIETIEGRDQVLEEIKKKEEKKNVSLDVTQHLYEEDIKKHVETRRRQEEDIKLRGETSLQTKLDQLRQKRLDDDANKDVIHDQRFIERYQRLSSYTIESLSHFHPKLFRTEDGKKFGVDTMRALYELYRHILVESGELKEVKIENADENKVIDRLNSVDTNIIDAEIVENTEN